MCRAIQAKLYKTEKADPKAAIQFEEKFTRTGGRINATEGVVLDWNGDKYKWTGSFGFINRLLGGDR